MRLKITLEAKGAGTTLPANYQYPLSATIYKILQQSDADYSQFLHETGYRKEGSLKIFNNFDRKKIIFIHTNLYFCFLYTLEFANFLKHSTRP